MHNAYINRQNSWLKLEMQKTTFFSVELLATRNLIYSSLEKSMLPLE